jgi:chromosome segregation ATPase
MLWSQHLQATLGAENEHLKGQVHDLQLDLTDAVKSRRELQQQLQEAEAKMDSMAQAHDFLKVRFEVPPSEPTELVIEKLQKQNPYIAVMIDGDGLLV